MGALHVSVWILRRVQMCAFSQQSSPSTQYSYIIQCTPDTVHHKRRKVPQSTVLGRSLLEEKYLICKTKTCFTLCATNCSTSCVQKCTMVRLECTRCPRRMYSTVMAHCGNCFTRNVTNAVLLHGPAKGRNSYLGEGISSKLYW